MPNPLTGVVNPPQKSVAPDAARTSETEVVAGAGFLDILNMVDQITLPKPEATDAEMPDSGSENASDPTEPAAPEVPEGSDLSTAQPTTQPLDLASDTSETKVIFPALQPDVSTKQGDEVSKPETRAPSNTQARTQPDGLHQHVGQVDLKADLPEKPQRPMAETIQQAAILRAHESRSRQDTSTDKVGETGSTPVKLASATKDQAPHQQPAPIGSLAVRVSALNPDAKGRDDKSVLEPTTEAAGTVRESTLTANTRDIAAGNGTTAARAEVARAVAGQLAAAITAKPGSGHIEIALNPEELGRVSITMGGRDDGLHLLIAAERPETLDLMRRHMSTLASEFQKLGYSDLSFDLNLTDGQDRDTGGESAPSSFDVADQDSTTDAVPQPYPSSPGRGLDLRL